MSKIKRTNQVIFSSDDPRDNKARAYSTDINWERSNTEFLYSMKLIAEGNGTSKGGSSLDSEIIKEILDRLQNGSNNNTTPLQDLSQYAIQETTNVSGLINEPQIVKFTGDFSLIKILYTINGETAQQYTSDGIIINEPGFYRLAVYSLPINETDITKYKDNIKKDITYNPSIAYNPSVEYDAESDKIIVNININNLNLYNINELKFKFGIGNSLDLSETDYRTINIISSMISNSNIQIIIEDVNALDIYKHNDLVIFGSYLIYYNEPCSDINKMTIKNEIDSNIENEIQFDEFNIHFSWAPDVEDALNNINNYAFYYPEDNEVDSFVGYYGLNEDLSINDNLPNIKFRLLFIKNDNSSISEENQNLSVLWDNKRKGSINLYHNIGSIKLENNYNNYNNGDQIFPPIIGKHAEYTVQRNEWDWTYDNLLKIVIVNSNNDIIFKYEFNLENLENFDELIAHSLSKYVINDIGSLQYTLSPTPLSEKYYKVDKSKNNTIFDWYATPELYFTFDKYSSIEIEENNSGDIPQPQYSPRLRGTGVDGENDGDDPGVIAYNNQGGGKFGDDTINDIETYLKNSIYTTFGNITGHTMADFNDVTFDAWFTELWKNSLSEHGGYNTNDLSIINPQEINYDLCEQVLTGLQNLREDVMMNVYNKFGKAGTSFVLAKDNNNNLFLLEATVRINTGQEYHEDASTYEDMYKISCTVTISTGACVALSNKENESKYLCDDSYVPDAIWTYKETIPNPSYFDIITGTINYNEDIAYKNALKSLTSKYDKLICETFPASAQAIYNVVTNLLNSFKEQKEYISSQITNTNPDVTESELNDLNEVINNDQYSAIRSCEDKLMHSTIPVSYDDNNDIITKYPITALNFYFKRHAEIRNNQSLTTEERLEQIQRLEYCIRYFYNNTSPEWGTMTGDNPNDALNRIIDKFTELEIEYERIIKQEDTVLSYYKYNTWPSNNYYNNRYTPLYTGWTTYPSNTKEKWINTYFFDNINENATIYTNFNDDIYYHIIYYNKYNENKNLKQNILNTNLLGLVEIYGKNNDSVASKKFLPNPYSINIFALTNERLNKNSQPPFEIFKDSIFSFNINIVTPKFFPIIMCNIDKYGIIQTDINGNYTGHSHIITDENNNTDGIYINGIFEGYYRPNRSTGQFSSDTFSYKNISNYILYDTEFLDNNELIVIPYSTDYITIFTGSVPYIDKEWRITFKKKYSNGYDVTYTDDYQTKVKYISYPICKFADNDIPDSVLDGGGAIHANVSMDDYLLVGYKREKIKLYKYNPKTNVWDPSKEQMKLGDFKMYKLEGGHKTTLEMYIQHFCEQYQNPNMDYDLLDNWTKYRDINILMGCAKNNQGYGEEVFEYVYKTYENFWNFANNNPENPNHYDIEETEEGYYYFSATSIGWSPNTNSFMADIKINYDNTQHRVYAQKMTQEELDNIYFIPISLDENKVPSYFNATHNVHIPTYKKTVITGKRKVGTEVDPVTGVEKDIYENITKDVYKMIGIHVNEQNIKYWRAGNYNDHIKPDGLHRMEAIIDFNDADTNNYYELINYLNSVNKVNTSNITHVNSITLDNNSPTNSGTVINCNAVNSVYDNFNENVVVKYNNCNFRVSGDLEDINTINIIDDNNIEMNNLVGGNFGVLTNENMTNYRYYFEEPTIVNGIEEKMITWKSAENLFNFYENLSKSKILLSDEFINSINNITKGINTFVKSNVISQEKGNSINGRITQIKQNFKDFKESLKYIDEYAEHGDPVDLDPVDLTNH